MDLVYICRPGDNEELRYSIRSAVENLPHDNIWVVGAKPDWYTGNFIKVRRSPRKYDSAIRNLTVIANSKKISDNFILMNDDFFIMNKIDKIETYHNGLFPENLNELATRDRYKLLLVAARDFLIQQGYSNIFNYELHVPMPMSKFGLGIVLEFGILWRTAYGNMFSCGGTPINDVKIRKEDLENLKNNNYEYNETFLSTEDDTYEVVIKNILSKRFPNPSKYE